MLANSEDGVCLNWPGPAYRQDNFPCDYPEYNDGIAHPRVIQKYIRTMQVSEL